MRFVLILGIPRQAESLGEWVFWIAAICAALGVIVASGVKSARWAKKATRAGLLDVLQPEFDTINAKMDTLAVRNDEQHAQVAGQISELSHELAAHNKVLTDHLDESANAAVKLAEVVKAVETHIGELRDEITSPGLPTTPGPPVGGPKHLY